MTGVSDSQRDEEFFGLGNHAESAYWLRLVGNHETFNSCLIGNNDVVADELTRYPDVSVTLFIVTIPPSEDVLGHCRGLRWHRRAGAGRWT